MNKYRSGKLTIDGMTFDSHKEYHRYCQLYLLSKMGEVSELQRQVKFVLIPTQREASKSFYMRGEKKGQPREGKLIEKEVAYYADFVYRDNQGRLIVEDVKGVRTEAYKIKRKMMLYFHGIRVQEV